MITTVLSAEVGWSSRTSAKSLFCPLVIFGISFGGIVEIIGAPGRDWVLMKLYGLNLCVLAVLRVGYDGDSNLMA